MAARKGRIAAAAAAVLVIAAAVVWYVASPAWTLKGMKDAAQSQNSDALDAYIDYPALRASLDSQLTARMAARAERDRSGLGALGAALGKALMGPVIDELVTPAGIRAALFASDQGRKLSATSALRLPKQPTIVRRNLSEFLVTSKDHPDSGLVFRRHGLSWMLSGVELAPDGPPPTP